MDCGYDVTEFLPRFSAFMVFRINSLLSLLQSCTSSEIMNSSNHSGKREGVGKRTRKGQEGQRKIWF